MHAHGQRAVMTDKLKWAFVTLQIAGRLLRVSSVSGWVRCGALRRVYVFVCAGTWVVTVRQFKRVIKSMKKNLRPISTKSIACIQTAIQIHRFFETWLNYYNICDPFRWSLSTSSGLRSENNIIQSTNHVMSIWEESHIFVTLFTFSTLVGRRCSIVTCISSHPTDAVSETRVPKRKYAEEWRFTVFVAYSLNSHHKAIRQTEGKIRVSALPLTLNAPI